MSTQLDSWKYFAEEDIESKEAGEKILGPLKGTSDEVKPCFSTSLMVAEWTLGVMGFWGLTKALGGLAKLFFRGAGIEGLKMMIPYGLNEACESAIESEYLTMMLVLTILVVKILVSCGMLGVALMLERRVNYANWFAGIVCLGAILFNLLNFGLQIFTLTNNCEVSLPENQAEIVMTGVVIFISIVFLFKVLFFLGLVVFFNSRTNTAIFTPQERTSLA